MDWVYKRLDKRVFELDERFEFAGFLFLGLLAFLIPFTVGGPQLLVGTLVNAFFVLASLSMGAKKVLSLAVLPSLGAIARGVLFGPFTFALVFMAPFIWAGNMLLMLILKWLFAERKMNYFVSLGIGALAKAGVLFCFAFLLLQLGLVPALFLTAMGLVQLGTAIAGGLLAFALWKGGARLGVLG